MVLFFVYIFNHQSDHHGWNSNKHIFPLCFIQIWNESTNTHTHIETLSFPLAFLLHKHFDPDCDRTIVEIRTDSDSTKKKKEETELYLVWYIQFFREWNVPWSVEQIENEKKYTYERMKERKNDEWWKVEKETWMAGDIGWSERKSEYIFIYHWMCVGFWYDLRTC